MSPQFNLYGCTLIGNENSSSSINAASLPFMSFQVENIIDGIIMHKTLLLALEVDVLNEVQKKNLKFFSNLDLLMHIIQKCC